LRSWDTKFVRETGGGNTTVVYTLRQQTEQESCEMQSKCIL